MFFGKYFAYDLYETRNYSYDCDSKGFMSGERFFRSNDNLRTCYVKEEYYYKK